MPTLITVLSSAAIWIATFFAPVLHAQGGKKGDQDQKQTVAVIQPIGTIAVTDSHKHNVRDALAEVLVKTDLFAAQDPDTTDRIMAEHGFRRSMLSNSSKAKQIGKMLGADLICIADLMKEDDVFQIVAFMIGIETGEITHTARAYVEDETDSGIRKVVAALVDGMLEDGEWYAPSGTDAPADSTQPLAHAEKTPKPLTVVATGIRSGERRNLKFGPYTWRVLDVLGDRALLITEEIIEQRGYHDVDDVDLDTTWENCSLRSYLNGGFLQKFTADERGRILETEIQNPNNPQYGTQGGGDTVDKVFLLSIEEAEKYFSSDADRAMKRNGSPCSWCLRSPGYIGCRAAIIDIDGEFFFDGIYVVFDDYGVRPALWLSL